MEIFEPSCTVGQRATIERSSPARRTSRSLVRLVLVVSCLASVCTCAFTCRSLDNSEDCCGEGNICVASNSFAGCKKFLGICGFSCAASNLFQDTYCTDCTWCSSVSYCQSGASCTVSQCSDLTSSANCNAAQACHWCSALGGACLPTAYSCKTDCTQVTSYGSTYCAALSSCKWCTVHNGRCKSSTARCQTYTVSNSHSSSVRPSQSSTATLSLMATASMSRSVSPTIIHSATGSRSPTKTASGTTSVSLTPSITHSLSVSASASDSPTSTSTHTITVTPTGVATATQSGSLSPSSSSTPSTTTTPTATQSKTPSDSASSTRSSTPSVTVSPTSSQTASLTTSSSPTTTRSSSPSQTASPSDTVSPSSSGSLSASHTSSKTSSHTPTVSATATPSSSITVSTSVSQSGTNSATQSRTRSPSLSASPSTTITASVSSSRSSSLSASQSTTLTASVSHSRSGSFSASQSTTSTASFSSSGTDTDSLSNIDTASMTRSATDVSSTSQSVTVTSSFSGSRSQTASQSATQSSSITATDSETVTVTTTDTGTSTISLVDLSPRIYACAIEALVYVGTQFTVVISGAYLLDSDSFYIAPDRFACLSAPLHLYYHVFWVSVDRRTVHIQYTVNSTEPFSLCYQSSQLGRVFNLSCPQTFTVDVDAPWATPSALVASAQAVEIAPGVSLAENNYETCVSAYLPAYDVNPAWTGGVLNNPVSALVQFGNASQRIRRGEACAFYVKQLPQPATTSTAGYQALNVSLVHRMAYEFRFESFLSSADLLVLWMKNDSFFARSMFPEAANLESAEVVPGSCLTEPTGFRPVFRASEGVTTLRLPPEELLITACAAAGAQRGFFATVQYRRVPSVCTDDCTDGSGIRRGVCSNTTFTCVCDDPEELGGANCATPLHCNSLLSNASTNITAPYGSWAMNGNGSCAAILTADGSNVLVAGGFTIALRVTQLFLNDTDCSRTNVTIRLDNASGTVLRTLCASDVNAVLAGSYPMLIQETGEKVLHIAYVGTSPSDYVVVNFTSISTSCPGTRNVAGFVTPDNECSNRGLCVPIEVGSLSTFPVSTKTCSCYSPWATSSVGSTCDACEFGKTPWTFPACTPLPVCEAACNLRGNCTIDGCQCWPPYFGRLCELQPTTAHLQASQRLGGRLSLDLGSGAASSGDATAGGSSGFLTCQVSGCETAERNVGNSFFSANESLQTNLATDNATSPAQQSDSGGAAAVAHRWQSLERRRRPPHSPFLPLGAVAAGGSGANASVSNASNATAANTTNSDRGDQGVALNTVTLPGAGAYYVQYHIRGTSQDVHGPSTFTFWTRFTTASAGFLYAKLDTARYADGTIPVLEKAIRDIQNRHAPLESLLLRDTNTSLYFGIYINGPLRRVDVISVDADERDGLGNHTTCEDSASSSGSCGSTAGAANLGRDAWFYSRSFTMDEEARSALFDGNWHFVALTLRRGLGRWEGQLYVDGGTIDGSVLFDQCLPFLPNAVSNRSYERTVAAASGDPSITSIGDGGMIVVGYRLQASLDEVRLYKPALSQVSLVDIAGPSYHAALRITFPVLVLSASVCLMTLAGSVTLFLARREGIRLEGVIRRRNPLDSSSSSDSDIEGDDKGPSSTRGTAAKPPPLLVSAAGMKSKNNASADGEDDDDDEDSGLFAMLDAESDDSDGCDAVADNSLPHRPPVETEEAVAEPRSALLNGVLTMSSSFSRPRSHDSSTELSEAARGARVSRSGSCNSGTAMPSTSAGSFQRPKSRDAERAVEMVDDVAADMLAPSQAPTASSRFLLLAANSTSDPAGETQLPELASFHVVNLDDVNHDRGGGDDHHFGDDNGDDDTRTIAAATTTTTTAVTVAAVPEVLSKSQRRRSVSEFLEDDDAQQLFRMMSLRESKGGRAARNMRSAFLALGNTSYGVGSSAGGGGGGVDAQGVVATAWKGFLEGAGLMQGVWQMLALHLSAFPWPDIFQVTFGEFIGAISLNFDVSFQISFEVGFYALAAAGLLSFLVIAFFVIRDLASDAPQWLQVDRIKALLNRLDNSADGTFTAERTPAERITWLALLTLTTLYLPITRSAVIGAFCYRTIQCEFDCYHEERHWRIVYLSAALIFCVTLMGPVILFAATYRKRSQFLGKRVVEKDAGVAEDVQLERDWHQFLILDKSPYGGVYENFKFSWAYFQSAMILNKALCVFLSLGLASNTNAQLLALTFLHCGFSFLFAISSPFQSDVSNLITAVGQWFVVLTLGLNAISRINPDERFGEVVGYVLIGVAFVCLGIQVMLISRCISLSMLADGMVQILPARVRKVLLPSLEEVRRTSRSTSAVVSGTPSSPGSPRNRDNDGRNNRLPQVDGSGGDGGGVALVTTASPTTNSRHVEDALHSPIASLRRGSSGGGSPAGSPRTGVGSAPGIPAAAAAAPISAARSKTSTAEEADDPVENPLRPRAAISSFRASVSPRPVIQNDSGSSPRGGPAASAASPSARRESSVA